MSGLPDEPIALAARRQPERALTSVNGFLNEAFSICRENRVGSFQIHGSCPQVHPPGYSVGLIGDVFSTVYNGRSAESGVIGAIHRHQRTICRVSRGDYAARPPSRGGIAALLPRLHLSRVQPRIDAQGCFRSSNSLQNPLTLNAGGNAFCFFAQPCHCVGKTFLE